MNSSIEGFTRCQGIFPSMSRIDRFQSIVDETRTGLRRSLSIQNNRTSTQPMEPATIPAMGSRNPISYDPQPGGGVNGLGLSSPLF